MMKVKTDWAILLFLAVMFVGFIFIPRLFTGFDLAFQLIAACLGAIITMFITRMLLQNQSHSEEEKEKNTKVFEEKLRIYKEFLATLCKTLEDGKITQEESIRLQFQASYIAMHTESKRINDISKNVSEIVNLYSPNNENKDMTKPLLSNLFNIVEAFRKELYGDKIASGNFTETIDNFANFGDAVAKIVDVTEKVDAASKLPDTWTPWKNSKIYEGWTYKTVVNCPIRFVREGMTFFVQRNSEGRWRFGVSLDDDRFNKRQVYIYLRYSFGGRFSTAWDWSVDFDEKYQTADAITFMDRVNNDDALGQYVNSMVDKILTYMNPIAVMHQDITVKFKPNELELTDKPWHYWNETLAFDFKPTKEGIKPFIDVISKNGSYKLQFGVRGNKEEDLRLLAEEIGLDSTHIDESSRITYENLPSIDAYIEKIKEINQKLRGTR